MTPAAAPELARRWRVTLRPAWSNGAGRAWVAPATRDDGTRAVLKIAWPHFEGEHEIEGLRFWDGDATVRLLEADERVGAMLLERCEPGAPLTASPSEVQDDVVASLLRRLWRVPAEPHPFRPLSTMLARWTDEALAARALWPDPGLVQEGLRLFETLGRPSKDDVLLATDLHAGNVLKANREAWLAIDPKPFVGDRAYDAVQHLLNDLARLSADPTGTIGRFADRLEVDRERVRLWTLARLAAGPHERWERDVPALARELA